MTIEYFDIAIEGTTLVDLKYFDKSLKKIVVVDKSSVYGTSYKSIDQLSKSKYISNLSVRINNLSENAEFTLESMPFLLGHSDETITKFNQKIFSREVEFISISNLYYISNSIDKLPGSKNEIALLNLSLEDSFYLFDYIKNLNLEKFKRNFSDRNHFLYKALVILKILNNYDLEMWSTGFGVAIYKYPIYGMTEISESACFINSFNAGTTYIIDENLSYETGTDEYKHKINCELGTAYSREFQPNKLIKKKYHVRIIMANGKIFNGSFLAFIELDDGANSSNETDSDCFTRVIGLDSCGICDEGHQIFYFIKEKSEVQDYELSKLKLSPENIILDLSFNTNYDIYQFCRKEY